ncbi:MAG: hypothetical protein F6K54_19010 [Okeania sp. SIO3B5]|uniref:hypothetical protein n=1 Tax=Okeania sp. SIO3B5 TaxID=2607811 RepID=UPI0013FEA48B|nr:hypothetical protein [Okeania sp. SIO3B5]NEO54982.1 hypothetical protein [Okeania sp. SIO3B5]
MIDNTNDFIQTIIDQIHEDEKRLSDGEQVSNIALKIPRIDSGEDKRLGLGHKLARQLFPALDAKEIMLPTEVMQQVNDFEEGCATHPQHC